MQIAGAGHAVRADEVRAEMLRSPEMSLVLLQAAHVFMTQLSSTVLANGRATLTERLSRWLLMAADRQDDDRVPLTHEFLSIMIGVRRAGVTTTLRDLESRGFVRRSRGEVEILDRDGLIAKYRTDITARRSTSSNGFSATRPIFRASAAPYLVAPCLITGRG